MSNKYIVVCDPVSKGSKDKNEAVVMIKFGNGWAAYQQDVYEREKAIAEVWQKEWDKKLWYGDPYQGNHNEEGLSDE